MIQTVKIAPIEAWCPACINDAIKHGVNIVKIVGMAVDIDTESMEPHWADEFKHLCEGRIWKLTAESTDRLLETSGLLPSGETSFLCEHLLEMD